MSSVDAIVPLLDAPEGAPASIAVGCFRLGLVGSIDRPLCCACGAAVDGRAVITLRSTLADLSWSSEGPHLDDRAPSGVVERLATIDGACAALDRGVIGGGILGDGCRIRASDPTKLLDDCAFFPLDLVGGGLVPSIRIPEDALHEVAADARSLWDLARTRVGERFGAAYVAMIDAASEDARARHSRGLHLKTMK